MRTKIGAALFFLVFIPVLAYASVDPSTDPSGFVDQIFGAIGAHRWDLAGVLAVIGVVSLLRWLAPKLHDKLGALLTSNRGGAVLALVNGIAVALATTLLGGDKLTPKIVVTGLGLGVAAAGGWNVLWDLLAPSDKKTPPSGVEVSPPTPPITKAAAFIPIAFIALTLSGCGTAGGQALGRCELGQLAANEQTVLVDATQIITTGGADWQGQLAGLGASLAPGQLECALQAIAAAWSAAHGAVTPERRDALTRLNQYLAAHPAKACGPSSRSVTRLAPRSSQGCGPWTGAARRLA